MSVGTLTIIEKPHVATIRSTGQRILVGQPTVRIITVGTQGAPGTPGDGSPFSEEVQVGILGLTEYELTNLPVTDSVHLYINGIRQRSNSFTISTQTITLPLDLDLTSGDWLMFSYLF